MIIGGGFLHGRHLFCVHSVRKFAPLAVVGRPSLMRKMRRLNLCSIAAMLISLSLHTNKVHAEQQCERLKASLTYRQEEAPGDLSTVLPVVVERVNRELSGVVDVEVEWKGDDLHGIRRVGEHFVKCKVTRLASAVGTEIEGYLNEEGREVVTQCFQVPFHITDTNECVLPMGHPMRHGCHESTICVNTDGSYECVCPRLEQKGSPSGIQYAEFFDDLESQDRSLWELSFDSLGRTSCPSMPWTRCCPRELSTTNSASCRASFRCPVDPCVSKSNNECSNVATCVRKASPVDDDPNYECQCPAGLMGNGRKCRPGIDRKPEPEVMFDGVTPTEETLKNNYYCDCTEPVIDACSGFPPCEAKNEVCRVSAGGEPQCVCGPGYVMHEKYGCVDESPPVLKLKNDPDGDNVLRLKQGDIYQEYMVDIEDKNAEDYLRSLKIAYSQPLPQGCLLNIGEFEVNYTVATPWTSPPYARVTRRVVIEDINECKLDVAQFEKHCPQLLPRCDIEAGAKCENTVGSYTCRCPKYTTGDGFMANLSFHGKAPDGYKGGTGCRDTSKPVISLVGPNPKVFMVCDSTGLTGIIDGGRRGKRDDAMKKERQQHYDGDIKELIRTTAGAELCATHSITRPMPSDCVEAYDYTFNGEVDLSKEVVVGEPVQKSALHWTVPYNVNDEAGNAADTVWRDIRVEEINLAEIEAKVRSQVTKEKRAEIQRKQTEILRLEKALMEERKKNSDPVATVVHRRQQIKGSESGPKCPPCDCSGKIDENSCAEICQSRVQTCASVGNNFLLRGIMMMEKIFPPSVVPFILGSVFVFCVFMMLRWTVTFIFNPQVWDRTSNRDAQPPTVAYFFQDNGVNSKGDAGNGTASAPSPRVGDRPAVPPKTSVSVEGMTSFFSPRAEPVQRPPPSPFNGGGQSPAPAMQEQSLADSIYADSSPIISPNKYGEGVQRRNRQYER